MSRPLIRRFEAFEPDAPVDLTDLTATAAEMNQVCDGAVATAADLNKLASSLDATLIGAATGTGVACTITRNGPFAKLDFTFTNTTVTWTDAGGSGASGSVKIFDFVQGAWQSLGSRANLTFASDTTMDVAGDLAMVFGVGSVAANAGDAALTGTEVDFVPISGTITFSANAATLASQVKGAGAAAVDGTATASDIYLNFSGSAATSDANGVLTVNGTLSLVVVNLGDN